MEEREGEIQWKFKVTFILGGFVKLDHAVNYLALIAVV